VDRNHPQSTSKTATCGRTNANLPSFGPTSSHGKSLNWLASFEPRNPKPHERLERCKGPEEYVFWLWLWLFLGFATHLSFLQFSNSSALYLACSRLLFFHQVLGPFITHPLVEVSHPSAAKGPFIIYYDTDHTHRMTGWAVSFLGSKDIFKGNPVRSEICRANCKD